MIPLLNSFSIRLRFRPEIVSPDKCLVGTFSLGVLDKRYPKNDKVILRFMSLEFTEGGELEEVKIIRVK